jgi:hypothetical protein
MVHCTTSTTCDHNHFPSASCQAHSHELLTLEWSTVQHPQHATTTTFRQHRVKHTHMYYLHSNGPLYNIHNMRPQPLSVSIVSSTLTYITDTRMVHCTTSTTCDHNHFPSASCQAHSHILLTLEWSTVQHPQHATTTICCQHGAKHT